MYHFTGLYFQMSSYRSELLYTKFLPFSRYYCLESVDLNFKQCNYSYSGNWISCFRLFAVNKQCSLIFIILYVEFLSLFVFCPQLSSLFFHQNSVWQHCFLEWFESAKEWIKSENLLKVSYPCNILFQTTPTLLLLW